MQPLELSNAMPDQELPLMELQPKMPFPEIADDGNHALRSEVMQSLKTVRDPEIPVNLVDLGLIYSLKLNQAGVVHIEMTLTTPACPVAGSLPGQVQHIISLVPGVNVVLVDLVWSPPWTRDRMSDEAKLELGLL